MPYLNPIHRYIVDFKNKINEIDTNLELKKMVNIWGQSLDEIDFSDINNDLRGFVGATIELLCVPLRNVSEKLLDTYTPEQSELFCDTLSKSITDIIVSRENDIEGILRLYQILTSNFNKCKKIVSPHQWLKDALIGFLKGMAIGFMGVYTDLRAESFISLWDKSNELNDEEFVRLYYNTINKFIEASFEFARNLDIDFIAVETLYQKYQEEAHSSLQQKIQMSLIAGDNIQNLYSTWRKTQVNDTLKKIPMFIENVVEELKTEGLDEKSINNIKKLVCEGSGM
jgi:hypothetical protein